MSSICIASKSRTIGDPLMLSTLPARLKARYPQLRVFTYPRAFNPVVFAGNPHVEGVQYLPDAVFGDDCNWGEGHLIELKERYFGLSMSAEPHPELYLLPTEISEVEQDLRRYGLAENAHKPLCLIHPWGHTHTDVLSKEVWEQVIAQWKDRFRFWQVGIQGHLPIQGCEHHFLLPRPFHYARRLFALMSRAQLFLGVCSGPMHVARAFQVPSLIFTDYGMEADQIFKRRRENPYFSKDIRHSAFLYENNAHAEVTLSTSSTLTAAAHRFLESRLKS